MINNGDVAAARHSWTAARSSRMRAERLLEKVQQELAAAQAGVEEQQRRVEAAYQRETAAREYYDNAEKENTVEARAAQAARELAEAAQGLRERVAAAQALKERAEREALIAAAALAAFAEEQAGG